MKKTYSKPVIMFESFQLTASIAAECTYGDLTIGTGLVIFLDEPDCTVVPADNQDIGDFEAQYHVCYHVPGDSAFNS